MPREHLLSLTVNGEPARRLVPGECTLLDLLRGTLGLVGTKHGCEVGDCGACTVLVDGAPRLACITLAGDVAGCEVETIEGGVSGPIEAAFDRHVASQCGYCTPGFVMTLRALLRADPHPDESAIRQALGSNICRCTGYTKILLAAREAAARPVVVPGAR